MYFDFKNMAFTIPHPIYRKISDQYFYLKDLIETSTSQMEERYKIEEKECNEWAEQNAKEQAGDDRDIYDSVLANNNSAVDAHLDDLYEVQALLRHSLFIIVFSYFDSIATLIVQDKGFGAGAKAIEKLYDHYVPLLSEKAVTQFNYLKDTLRVIRDLLTHNWNGSVPIHENQLQIAELESAKMKGFTYNKVGQLEVTTEYVKESLELEHDLLEEIAQLAGYKRV